MLGADGDVEVCESLLENAEFSRCNKFYIWNGEKKMWNMLHNCKLFLL